jgi:hypothetical protein
MAHKTKDLPNRVIWADRARWVGRPTDLPPGHVGISRDVPYDPVREGADIMRWVERQRIFVECGEYLCAADPTEVNVEFLRQFWARMKGLWDVTHNTPYSRWPPRDFDVENGPVEKFVNESNNVSELLGTMLLAIHECAENEAWAKWY